MRWSAWKEFRKKTTRFSRTFVVKLFFTVVGKAFLYIKNKIVTAKLSNIFKILPQLLNFYQNLNGSNNIPGSSRKFDVLLWRTRGCALKFNGPTSSLLTLDKLDAWLSRDPRRDARIERLATPDRVIWIYCSSDSSFPKCHCNLDFWIVIILGSWRNRRNRISNTLAHRCMTRGIQKL